MVPARGQRSKRTVSFCLVGDSVQVFVQPLLEQIVLDVQLLLTGHIHGIYTEIWQTHSQVITAGRPPERQQSGASTAALTGAWHVRENDVDVDFEFVSSRGVDVQLRVDLQGVEQTSFSFNVWNKHSNTDIATNLFLNSPSLLPLAFVLKLFVSGSAAFSFRLCAKSTMSSSVEFSLSLCPYSPVRQEKHSKAKKQPHSWSFQCNEVKCSSWIESNSSDVRYKKRLAGSCHV